jgi:hypothetical protein
MSGRDIAQVTRVVTGAANERLNAVNGPAPVTGRARARCTAERRATTHHHGAQTDSAGMQ